MPMSGGSKAVVLVIDDRPLSQARTAALLKDWADLRGLRIIAADHSALGDASVWEHCRLLVLNHTGDDLDPRRAGAIRIAVGIGACPVVVLQEGDRITDIVRALRLGARAVIPPYMDQAQATTILDFVLAGGVYVPIDVLRLITMNGRTDTTPRLQYREPNGGADDIDADEPLSGNGENGGGDGTALRTASGAADTVPRAVPTAAPGGDQQSSDVGRLTLRQREVLEQLRLGLSNKEIARALEMSEPTVKVHVRQVMRKLGVTNRTQAALVRADHPLAPAAPPPARTHAAASLLRSVPTTPLETDRSAPNPLLASRPSFLQAVQSHPR